MIGRLLCALGLHNRVVSPHDIEIDKDGNVYAISFCTRCNIGRRI